MSDNPIKITVPSIGMKMTNPSQQKELNYSLLLNGHIQSVSDTFAYVTNELSNILCTRFKPGFKVINVQPVVSLNLTFFFLVNPTTGDSEIGVVYNQFNTDNPDKEFKCKNCPKYSIEDKPLETIEQESSCSYYTWVSAKCLNFNIDYPVRSWVKVDNCNVRLYFGAANSDIRYIDYEDYQKEKILECPRVYSDELDCEKLKIFKDTCYPKIDYVNIISGGQNLAGVYQFAIAYSDSRSNPITNYFYVTNPIPLGDKPITVETNYPVSKSIVLSINNLNTDFDYINLVVLKTISANNGQTNTQAYLVGTFDIQSSSINYTYSGIDKNILRDVALDELFKKTPKYFNPSGVTESNGYLMFYGLEESRTLNLQPVINSLRLKWQTVRFPEGVYKNPIIAANYKSFLRDEVYSFAIELIRNNSLPTARFHIPAPSKAEINTYLPTGKTVDDVIDNSDVFSNSLCDDTELNKRWQVYNTATTLTPPLCNETSVPELITLTDTQYCTGDQLLMLSIGGVNSFYYKPNNYPPSAIPYNLVDTLTPVTLSTNVSENPTGIVCNCSNFIDLYPEGAIITPQSLDLNPNSANSSISIDAEQYSTSVNLYIDPDDPLIFSSSEIPNPQNYPNTPSPCIDDTSPTGNGYIAFLEQKSNTSAANSLILYPSLNSQCSQYTPTFGSFISYTPSGYNCSENWYNFQCSSLDGVAGLIISTEAPLSSIPTSGYYLYVYESDGTTLVADLSSTQVVTNTNGSYILLTGLTPGSTYYVKITGCIEYNSLIPCKQLTFKLCLVTPSPLEVVKVDVPAVINITTQCDISYQGYSSDICEGQPYTRGNFAYWESSETYPCNEEVWGNLAGKPIRHYKFPDCKISPHFENLQISTDAKSKFFSQSQIVPIGITVDVEDIKSLLIEAENKNLITKEERLSICGFRILRSNRKGNESIISKGILYDVWKYKDNVYNSGNNILFPNFPFNDKYPNQSLIDGKLKRVSDLNKPFISHPNEDYSNNKYMFYGANTSYNNPGLGSELKLELELQGGAEGQFVQTQQHAKYQYVGTGMLQAAFGLSTIETYAESTALVLQSNAVPVGVLGSFVGLGFILALVSANFGAPGLLINHYYEWLDVLTKFAPFRNYAWHSLNIGNYSTYSKQSIVDGNIRRSLFYSEYLKNGVFNVQYKDGTQPSKYSKFNNIKRESGVYLNIAGDNFTTTVGDDNSRWFPGDDITNCEDLGYQYRNISSYYSSIKNYLPSQYGQINQIDYIDTGYNGVIDWNIKQDTSCDTIFGGDTYINRHWFRRQHSYFLSDAVGYQPNSDIVYSELGNVASPRFYFNYPVGADGGSGSAAIYGNVALRTDVSMDYNFACADSTGKSIYQAGLAFGIIGSIGASIGGIISIPITYGVLAGTASTMTGGDTSVFIKGRFFLYSYGIPGFITESDYNLDLRHGLPTIEGNFYPNVDLNQWTQPTSNFNLINFDNVYEYNNNYSKQNRENFGYVLPLEFNQTKEDCRAVLPNRLIYSLRDVDNSDKFDGNLIFPSNNFYDFSKAGGKLTCVFGSNNSKVVALQEDQCSIFNSYIATPNQSIEQATVGLNQLFNPNIPQQYIKTDLGYAGSQVNAYVSTEFGSFWVDNKRGQIFNYGESINNIIPEENAWWFKENLPFQILKYFPEVNIDNPYKYFGMLITYDQRLKRIIFTKKDYKPRQEYVDKIYYKDGEFYINENIIFPTDAEYFCDVSWTLGYSPLHKAFISFYSYTPNYYVSNNNYFSSGINFSSDETEIGFWNHNLTYKSYQVFYGKLHPFTLQYSIPSVQNNQLESVKYETEFRRYTDGLNYALNNDITYNKATIYNQNQSTGLLELIKKEKNNLYQISQYPKYLPTHTQILTENVENFWSFNNFHNIALNNGFPIMQYKCNPYLNEINPKAVSYAPTFFKNKLRSDYFNIRLTNDKYSNYQIVHKISLTKTNPSIS